MKFYEKGDRPLEIVTSRQWFIKTMDVPRGAARPRPRARLASVVHAGAARELDQRPRTATGASAASDSSACRSRSGIASREDGTVDHDARLLPAEDRLPIDPSTDVPDGYAAEQRGPPGRVLRRSRRHGHVGDLVALAADCRRLDRGSRSLRARRFRWTSVRRRTTSSGRGCSRPMLRAALRARVAAVEERGDLGLGARSRSQEDVEVEGQRRHAAGAARGARVGRRALLGGERPAGRGHGVRLGPDEGGPAPRNQAAQRVEVRAIEAWNERGGHLGRRSRPAHEPRAARAGIDRGSRELPLHARARAHGDVLLVLLRQLPRARESRGATATTARCSPARPTRRS